jgi:hypothetical protein
MNERIRKLAADARGQAIVGTTVDDEQWRQHEEFVEKFAELIVRECATFIDSAFDINEYSGEVVSYADGSQLKEHFGVEEQATEPNEWHTCPYAEEIHHDYDTLCDCDEERTYQCARDI